MFVVLEVLITYYRTEEKNREANINRRKEEEGQMKKDLGNKIVEYRPLNENRRAALYTDKMDK